MLKLLLVGHRGVGKSSFLQRWQRHPFGKNIHFFELDQEIVQRKGLSIKEIFSQFGETQFRQWEREVLEELVKITAKDSVVIDLGAGFGPPYPEAFQILHLCRDLDLSQAFFPDRPNLSGQRTLSEGSFLSREKNYQAHAHGSWTLCEGEDQGPGEEQLFAILSGKDQVRLDPHWLESVCDDVRAQKILAGQWLLSFCQRWEWRQDLLSENLIRRALENRPQDLFSLRGTSPTPLSQDILGKASLWDWPLEWGDCPEAPIISLHSLREENFAKTLLSLPERPQQIFKLAVEVHNFEDLELGWQWQQEAPKQRVFLPRSSQGRWSWFRLWASGKMPFNFVRGHRGTAQDQPTVLQALNYHRNWNSFFAILGSPVQHSLTPAFHRNFFFKRECNGLAIDMKPSELVPALALLREWGLKAAAVTSPLKKKCAQVLKQAQPVNTIAASSKAWQVTSTDAAGFEALLDGLKDKELAVWGGGDVLASLESLGQPFAAYSSRTGKLKMGSSEKSPEVVLWAVDGSRFRQQGVWPPSHWKPQWVIDVNYTPDSPGRAYADKIGCQYRSGLVMFQAQALKQQEFWRECGI